MRLGGQRVVVRGLGGRHVAGIDPRVGQCLGGRIHVGVRLGLRGLRGVQCGLRLRLGREGRIVLRLGVRGAGARGGSRVGQRLAGRVHVRLRLGLGGEGLVVLGLRVPLDGLRLVHTGGQFDALDGGQVHGLVVRGLRGRRIIIGLVQRGPRVRHASGRLVRVGLRLVVLGLRVRFRRGRVRLGLLQRLARGLGLHVGLIQSALRGLHVAGLRVRVTLGLVQSVLRVTARLLGLVHTLLRGGHRVLLRIPCGDSHIVRGRRRVRGHRVRRGGQRGDRQRGAHQCLGPVAHDSLPLPWPSVNAAGPSRGPNGLM